MKFVTYIREQMMQEYGFDMNDLEENKKGLTGPNQELKKLKATHKEKYLARNNISKKKFKAMMSKDPSSLQINQFDKAKQSDQMNVQSPSVSAIAAPKFSSEPPQKKLVEYSGKIGTLLESHRHLKQLKTNT